MSLSRPVFVRCVVVVLCFLSFRPVYAEHHSRHVHVVMDNGRRAAGVIDSGTNESVVQLRSTTPNIVLRVKINWNRIVEAKLDGRTLPVAELKRRAAELVTQSMITLNPEPSTRSNSNQIPNSERTSTITHWSTLG